VLERLTFSAAAKDKEFSQHLHAFGVLALSSHTRIFGPSNNYALTRLLASIRSAPRLRGLFKNVSVNAPSASSALIPS
jgi:hypothetical protein